MIMLAGGDMRGQLLVLVVNGIRAIISERALIDPKGRLQEDYLAWRLQPESRA